MTLARRSLGRTGHTPMADAEVEGLIANAAGARPLDVESMKLALPACW